MTSPGEVEVYKRLGIRPLINAAGNVTTDGGSTQTPSVKRAMAEVEDTWVEIQDLIDATGARIAELLEVEAAYVTAGCYAALALSTAACLSGNDEEKLARLPDTSGMKNEIILQKAQCYVFDRAYTISGGTLIEVGDENGCPEAQLEKAIGANTAAVAYYIQQQPKAGELSLNDTVRVACKHSIPVIVDAASRIWPLDYFKEVAQSGDLVCFGGKYFGATQTVGFVCGKKDLVRAVSRHGFVDEKPLGRAMKLNVPEIVGLLTGVEDWFSMDHEARFAEFDAKIATLIEELEGRMNVIEVKKVETSRHPGVAVYVVFDKESLGRSVEDVVDELYEGDPRIRVRVGDENTLDVSVHTLNDGEDLLVAEGIRRVLAGA